MHIRIMTIAAALCLQAFGQAQTRRDPFQQPAPGNAATAAATSGNDAQAASGNPPSKQADASPPMSLAERTAAIRKARQTRSAPASPPLTPEQGGVIAENGAVYRNDFFHFRILRPRQWDFYTAGRMNAPEGESGKALNLSPELNSSQGRVWGMGDAAGRNVMLSITPLPADAPSDLNQLAAALKKVSLSQLPAVQASEEKVLLGDSAQPFAAFRCAFSVNNVRLVQSVQLTKANGFLLVFTTTGGSDEGVSDALRILSASLSW